MEMSRQRLRTGVLEATTRSCPHCDGTGLVRTASSAGLSALRLIEEEAARGRGTIITLSASTEASVYLLNAKRAELMEIEERYGVTVEVIPEGENEGAKMAIGSSGPRPTSTPKFEPIVQDVEDDEDLPEDDFDDEDEEDQAREPRLGRDDRGEREDGDRGKKRRRRRGGRNRRREGEREEGERQDGETVADDAEGDAPEREAGADEDRPAKKRRRRGGRGRRGGRERDEGASESEADGLETVAQQVEDDMPVVAGPDDSPHTAEAVAEEEAPKPKRTRRKKPVPSEAEGADVEAELADAPLEAAEAEKPKRTRRKKTDTVEVEAAPAGVEAEAPAKPKRTRKKVTSAAAENPEMIETPIAEEPAPAENSGESDGKPRRGGWWQRTFGE
jgi:ribonuclease E